MSFDLTQKVRVINPHANIDELYGTYNSVAEALAAVPAALRQIGRTVGIIEAGQVVEYWFKSDINTLVVKNQGGGDSMTMNTLISLFNSASDESKQNFRTAAGIIETGFIEAGGYNLTLLD